MKARLVDPERLASTKRWTLLACLCLLGITLAEQAFHLHSNELANADFRHCPACQMAHAPFALASITSIPLGLTTVPFLATAADPHFKPVLVSFSLFCRPPPSV
jgi:hypothetical protein